MGWLVTKLEATQARCSHHHHHHHDDADRHVCSMAGLFFCNKFFFSGFIFDCLFVVFSSSFFLVCIANYQIWSRMSKTKRNSCLEMHKIKMPLWLQWQVTAASAMVVPSALMPPLPWLVFAEAACKISNFFLGVLFFFVLKYQTITGVDIAIYSTYLANRSAAQKREIHFCTSHCKFPVPASHDRWVGRSAVQKNCCWKYFKLRIWHCYGLGALRWSVGNSLSKADMSFWFLFYAKFV